ncbi:hypothetical protein BN1723_002882, partial [Verticillium longisporum]
MKRARIEEPVASSSSGHGSGTSAVPSGRGSTSEPQHQSKISRKIRASMTRENSPETAHPRIKEDQAIVDAPMASLFEVTKLRNIRSDPGSRADALLAARRSGEPDFIAQGRVPLAEAEQLFA